MDLDFNLDELLAPGARKRELEFAVARELRPADLALLATNRSVQPIEIKKLSERHHTIARLLAEGMTHEQAATTVGMQPARISALKQSPAFAELIVHYRTVVDIQFAEMAERMAGLGKDAVLTLHERLEDAPDDFTNGQLLDMVKTLADRTGNGPSSSTEVTLKTELGNRLNQARIRARTQALGNGNVIEAEVLDPLDD